MKIINSLWVEKFRPKKIDDIIFSEDQGIDFKRYIDQGEIPHLLLYCPPGSGKTTLAQIISSKNGILKNPDDNLLEINGSSKKTRGISYVDDVIVPFLLSSPLKDKHKIVFIDEADYLTDYAFNSLRNSIEKFQKNNRFILTFNYVSKIPSPLISRLQSYEFKRMSIEYINSYCENILESENITYKDKDLQYIISNLYPDIRRIINKLQRYSQSGKLIINKDVILTNENLIITSIIEIIKGISENKNPGIYIENILKLVNEKEVEYRSIYTQLFENISISPPIKIIVNDYANKHRDSLVPYMHFMSMVFSIIKSLKQYKK